MNTEKKMQERTGAEKPLTDLETQILELYRQLPAAQRKMMLLSAVLSAAANGAEEVRA